MHYPPEKMGTDLLLAVSQVVRRLPDVAGADAPARRAVVGQDVDVVGAEPGLLAGGMVGVAEPVRARQATAQLLRLLDVGHRAVAQARREDPLAAGKENGVLALSEAEQP